MRNRIAVAVAALCAAVLAAATGPASACPRGGGAMHHGAARAHGVNSDAVKADTVRSDATRSDTEDARDGAHCHAGAPDRPVHLTIKDLMDSIVDPSADALWGAVGTVVDDKGIQDLVPKSADDWHDVRRAAVRLVEGMNLVMMKGRAAAPPGTASEAPGVELEPAAIAALIARDRRGFDADARALQRLAVESLRAAEAKDAAALQEIGGRMEEACESCHRAFWYPPGKRAAGK